jgi:hypothetical protein
LAAAKLVPIGTLEAFLEAEQAKNKKVANFSTVEV